MNYVLEQLVNQKSNFYKMVNSRYREYLWGLRLINVESLWDEGLEGELKKIRIAIIDSGYDYLHDDLKNIQPQGFNYINDSMNVCDDFGHGTKICGIIAAPKRDGGISGIANGADIVNLKVINDKGIGRIRNIIKAFLWSLENNIDIINLSIGHPEELDLEDKYIAELLIQEYNIVKKAIQSGIVVVGAVGNMPRSKQQFPACCEGVIPVASYGVVNVEPVKFYASSLNSNFNENTIFAPGEHILTTVIGNKYAYDSGSSIAAAHITGILAYFKAKNRKLSSYDMHRILIETSVKIKIDNEYINIVNTQKALELL